MRSIWTYYYCSTWWYFRWYFLMTFWCCRKVKFTVNKCVRPILINKQKMVLFNPLAPSMPRPVTRYSELKEYQQFKEVHNIIVKCPFAYSATSVYTWWHRLGRGGLVIAVVRMWITPLCAPLVWPYIVGLPSSHSILEYERKGLNMVTWI